MSTELTLVIYNSENDTENIIDNPQWDVIEDNIKNLYKGESVDLSSSLKSSLRFLPGNKMIFESENIYPLVLEEDDINNVLRYYRFFYDGNENELKRAGWPHVFS